MRNGKYTARRTSGAKVFTLMLALVLLVGCVAGGTLAWLTATTVSVENTFTVGDINITLAETTGTDYKIIPGGFSQKDPKVTVLKNSEKCYLFIHIEESNNTMTVGTSTEKLVSYDMVEGWSAVTGHDGFYYRVVDTNTADQPFGVFKDNKVTYNENIYKGQVNENNKPVITITAAAIQFDHVGATAAEAFTKLPNTFTGITA